MRVPRSSRWLSICATAVVLFTATAAFAECVGPSDVPTSLAAVVDEVPEDALSKGWTELRKNHCATVDWTGDTRPVPAPIGHFLDAWRSATGVTPDVRQLLTQQILVREAGREYWLVIQQQLLAPFRDEVGRGGKVTLQFKRFGAPAGGPPVIGVQEFVAGSVVSGAEATIATRGILRSLVARHPSAELRKELDDWITSGRVALAVESDVVPPEMAVTLFPIDGKLVPVMLINPEWLRGTQDKDLQRDLWSRQLVLYHEYIHLKDHFSGVVPLIPLERTKVELESKRAELAQRIWDAEYRAVRAEFELAKTLGATAMMPDIVQQIATKGSERGFLDGFYARLLSFSTTHQSDATIFFADWQKNYEKAGK